MTCRSFVLLMAIFVSNSICPMRLWAEQKDQWIFRNWQSREGIPENSVQAIAQTDDGFLWVGTSGGLARFDGESFETFDHGNTAAFKESNVPCLLVTRNKSLWVCTDGGRLIRWHQGRFERYSSPQGLDDSFIRALFEDADGTLWVGTASGLFRWKGEKAGSFTREPLLGDSAIHAIGQDRTGHLMLGGSALYSLSEGRLNTETFSGLGGDVNVKAILSASDGSLWVGSIAGLWRRRPGEQRFVLITGVRGPVNALFETHDGTIAIGTSGDGIYLFRKNRLDHIDGADSAQRSAVLAIFQDRDGSIWAGTQAGLSEMSQSPVEIVHLPGPSNLDFGTVHLDTDDTLWVASRRLFRVRDGTATVFSLPELHGAYVLNVIQDQARTLWLGTNGSGVFHVTPQGVRHYPVANGLANSFVRIMTEGRDGSIWIGTELVSVI